MRRRRVENGFPLLKCHSRRGTAVGIMFVLCASVVSPGRGGAVDRRDDHGAEQAAVKVVDFCLYVQILALRMVGRCTNTRSWPVFKHLRIQETTTRRAEFSAPLANSRLRSKTRPEPFVRQAT
jgi:cytochrome b561